jgi:hypothetical protein
MCCSINSVGDIEHRILFYTIYLPNHYICLTISNWKAWDTTGSFFVFQGMVKDRQNEMLKSVR